MALQAGYASPEDAEQDAVVILLEHLRRYPNAAWTTIRKYIRGRLWRLAVPTVR